MQENHFSSSTSRITNIFERLVKQLRHFGILRPYIDQILGDADISQLAKGSGIAFVFKLLSLPLGLATSLIISRWYGAEAMGLYGLTLTIISILVSIGMLGLRSAMPRFIGEASATLDTHPHEIYRTSLLLTVLSGALLSGGLYVCSSLIAIYIFDEPKLIFPLQVAAYFLVPLILMSLNTSYMLALKQIYHGELVSKILFPIILLGIIFVSYWIRPTYYIPIRAYLIAQTRGAGASIYLIRTHGYATFIGKTLARKPLLQISTPMLVTGIAFFVVTYTDIVMLGAMTDTATVGIYTIVVHVAHLVTFVFGGIAAFLGPQLSQKIREDTPQSLQAAQKLLYKANNRSTLSALGIAVILGALASRYLGFFGDEIGTSVTGRYALYILLIYQVINVVTGYGGLVLNNGGHEKTYQHIIVGCSFLNIVLNSFLIPHRGMIGAALSTAISFNIANMIVIYVCKQRTGLTPHLKL